MMVTFALEVVTYGLVALLPRKLLPATPTSNVRSFTFDERVMAPVRDRI